MIANSIMGVLQSAHGPTSFDEIVERVQRQSPDISRNALAGELANLINQQTVFLNQERTGFCATRTRRDSQRFLERAVNAAQPPSTVQFP